MLRDGDKLVVTKLDRLARNVMHMGELLQLIQAKVAGLVILSLGSETVDTSTATGKLILNMMVSVAQFEREMMKERQVEYDSEIDSAAQAVYQRNYMMFGFKSWIV